MQAWPALLPILLLTACSPARPDGLASAPPVAAISLNAAEKKAIGQKIWQNESGGTTNGLTAWNVGEEFPSLGIGHFIWYPAGFQGRWTESFPQFIKLARSRGANPPAIALQANAPWPSRATFMRDFNGPALTALRTWLSSNVELQTDFIILKSNQALPSILQATPADQRVRVRQNYQKVASTPNGTYALIDYVNFKGEGTNPTEVYNGQGWGLKHVLMDMREVPSGQAAAQEFAAAAKRRLDLRIKNSPPARGEARWRPGWHNRCDTYARPL